MWKATLHPRDARGRFARHSGTANKADKKWYELPATAEPLGSGSLYRRLTSGKPPAFRISGGSPETRKNAQEVMADATRDFPTEFVNTAELKLTEKLAGSVRSIITGSDNDPLVHGVYDKLDQSISMRASAFDNIVLGPSTRVFLEEQGWFSPSGIKVSALRTLTHEFGHHLDVKQSPAEKEQMLSEIAGALDFSPQEPGESFYAWMTRNEDKVILNVGTYAATNQHELTAELWTEYAGQREKARPAAQIVGRYYLKAFGK